MIQFNLTTDVQVTKNVTEMMTDMMVCLPLAAASALVAIPVAQ